LTLAAIVAEWLMNRGLLLSYACPPDVSPPPLQKDNGGPLVCEEHGCKIIIGVSVQRTKCASSRPALFVNVAFYSAWIYKVFRLYPG